LAVAGDLPGSAWQVALFTPTEGVERAARRLSQALIGALCFLALAALYLKELFWAARQKEANRLALVHAHEELEKKHKQLAALSRKLLNTAITDPLTGAHNRGHFLQITEKIINYVRRYDSELCVLLIDIDHFKRVNDTYGHPAGDEVLKQTTQVLRKMMRKSDAFARFGGEEFVIALADTSPDEALALCNRIREELERHPMLLDDGVTTIQVTMSGGLSKVLPGETSVDAALKRSDEALYESKKNGRNQISCRFEPVDPHAPPPPPLPR
jgi:two-component system, NtrC family, C4-dicarboxylate transport sensor histidine kinase DctB